MSTISYADLSAQLRREIYPFPGEAKNQVASHKKFVLEAFIDLCKWVDCLQSNHVDVHPACSTYVQCGKTVFDAPYGVVKRVYTIPNSDWCNQVFYSSGTYQEVECWARNLLSSFKQPDNTGLPALQQGYRYADKSSDSTCGRARVGKWAIHNRRFYLIPWVQSNESVVIEWDGVKTDWQDSDVLDLTYWSPDVQAAIKLFVQWSHERDFGTDPGYRRELRVDYEEARADLIFWCRERTKQQVEECGCDTPNRLPTSAELQEEVVQPTTAQVFAVIGDWGQGNDPGEIPMSKMVHGWNPDYVITVGDNFQFPPPPDTLAALDFYCGQYFQDYMWPYIGSYGPGSPTQTQRLFAALGNHDIDAPARFALVKQFFSMPSDYYDVVIGPIHWFILHGGYDNSIVNQEPDGITFDSIQGQWLRAKLALSTATWKIVVVHHPPFSSTQAHVASTEYDEPGSAGDGTISFPKLQWPFKTWGADAVLSGHCHNWEKLIGPDGFPYLIVGTGGGILADFRNPLLAMSVTHDKAFGAVRGTCDCKNLTLAWYPNGASVPFDSLVLNK